MLASSVTLGLVSDKLGRLRCIRIGFYLALAANLVALLAHSYSLLNVCIFLMSYGQVGAANALCTLRKCAAWCAEPGRRPACRNSLGRN